MSTKVSISTLHAHLNRQNLVKVLALRVPALTDLHVTKRLQWCKTMKGFDWSKAMFTDECSVWLNSRRVKVWTKRGQRVQFPYFKHPNKVHIWGGISILGTTPLRILTENFNQQVYIDTLNECLVTQANALYGNDWYLQEDNIPVHTGKAAKAWKSEFVPLRIDWPPNSPDLAPIENI